jgi:mannose-1-phosphate guanylyltransferase/mannose-1-phosphate guanylyltransferase/mannose-6-phosphate isomerase
MKTKPSTAAALRVVPVILSGGAGTRLWPMSRTLYPKQLLPLAGQDSMLVETVRRNGPAALFDKPILICNDEHRFIVAEQLRQAGLAARRIVLEPVGRNTAPAAAVAALIAAEEDPAALLLLAASDHVIADVDGFHRAVETGAKAAAEGALVTFGITPTRPETGYGYIRYAPRGSAAGELAAHAVERFVEKPDRAAAERYLAEGGYVWNSGMFLFRADRFIAELERLQPAMLAACRAAIAAAKTDLDFLRLDRAAFAACPADSIDYAVMEKTDRAVVVPVDIGWNDIGSWSALWDIGTKDADGYVLIGDALIEDVRNSYIRSDDGQLVAAVGLEDLVLVVTADAVFAANRHRAQDVKRIVERLKQAGRSESEAHPTVYRPWGWYQSVDEGDRFQVKRIMVRPGARLSAQMHHHRAEHWVVVAGTAKVLCGEDETLLFENQSIYIPLGTKHRLENPGKVPLHLIEVQSGSYLGEDDIVRFQDDYGRG